jgi:hypothetical protein
MNDLTKEDGREKLSAFFDLVGTTVVSRRRIGRSFAPVTSTDFTYTKSPVAGPVDCKGKIVRIITDSTADDVNLTNMVARLAESFSPPAEVVNLHDIEIKGGCLGCVKCGPDNHCAWEGKDGYIDFYRKKIMDSDILFFAGTMHDRYLSSLWKKFFDRSFFLCHQPKLNFGQVGFLISGPLRNVDNLKEIFTAYLEGNKVNPLGFVTDECGSSSDLDLQISDFARTAIDAALLEYRQPETFRSIGGIKLFRDEVYADMRFSFSSDHRYYRKNGYYDFPTRKFGTIALMNGLRFAAAVIPGFKKAYLNMLPKAMIRSYRKTLERSRKEMAME